MSVPSQTHIDVAPTNEESQPHSLTIETPQTKNSPSLSLDVDMIPTSQPDSPSLKSRKEPHSEAGDHHLLDDLLDHQPILFDLMEKSVPQHLKSISTDSTIISAPSSIPFSSSTDILHPLISDCPSMDMPNSSYPLIASTTPATDIPFPLTVSAQITILTSPISSANDLVVVQSLLGLREGSDMRERLGCS